jgi:hypothetical protein
MVSDISAVQLLKYPNSYDDERELLFAADEDFCKTSGPDTPTASVPKTT